MSKEKKKKKKKESMISSEEKVGIHAIYTISTVSTGMGSYENPQTMLAAPESPSNTH
jgi:hypothetical protein